LKNLLPKLEPSVSWIGFDEAFGPGVGVAFACATVRFCHQLKTRKIAISATMTTPMPM
jgi:hypothetical protein